jgi:putative endonuclease
MPNDRRRQLGDAGEQLAADHLARRGFQILERNYRTRWGELDIIAADGHTLVFVEVKCRVDNRAGRDPLESVHPSKRAQIRRIAGRWLADRPDHPRVSDLRFDAIGVTLDAGGRPLRLDHIEAAF